jgi:hypothetical protein
MRLELAPIVECAQELECVSLPGCGAREPLVRMTSLYPGVQTEITAGPGRVESGRGPARWCAGRPLAVSAVSGLLPELASDSQRSRTHVHAQFATGTGSPLVFVPTVGRKPGVMYVGACKIVGAKMEKATKPGDQVAFRKQGGVMTMPACGEDSRQIAAPT